jgi:hypothetical protein
MNYSTVQSCPFLYAVCCTYLLRLLLHIARYSVFCEVYSCHLLVVHVSSFVVAVTVILLERLRERYHGHYAEGLTRKQGRHFLVLRDLGSHLLKILAACDVDNIVNDLRGFGSCSSLEAEMEFGEVILRFRQWRIQQRISPSICIEV